MHLISHDIHIEANFGLQWNTLKVGKAAASDGEFIDYGNANRLSRKPASGLTGHDLDGNFALHPGVQKCIVDYLPVINVSAV